MKLRIKYFEGATKLVKISKGNWIDVYASKDVFIPHMEAGLIPLGFALELPEGWEGYLVPRSSTFKTWGIIQTNGKGIVDDTYIGDNDQWHLPAFCLKSHDWEKSTEPTGNKSEDVINAWANRRGTWIRKGDKVGQFRINEVMPDLELDEVEHLGNQDRGGFGSTGRK